MNLKKMALILAVAALPALAQSRWEATGTFVLASGDMNRMVDTSMLAGYSFGGGVRFEINPKLHHRLHAEAMSIRGKLGTGLQGRRVPRHYTLGYDVVSQRNEKWAIFGGPFLMKWSVNSASATLPDYTDGGARNNQGKGWKLGARLGAEYSYTANLKGVLSFNQTEFNKKLNPSWFSAGFAYRF